MEARHSGSLLSPYRVLDLTDEKGFLCGKVLADLGADVVKIEPPEGDPARNIGPFYHDIPDPEKSLFWFAYNMNKRGVTLNIKTIDGQKIFKELTKSADVVIESFSPGYMDSLGLGYIALSEINPRIIMTSITPFGQSGPYKNYKAPDIVGMAMGGMLYLCGDPDRPPVQIGFPQAYLHAAAEAVVGAMIALYHCQLTGEGQYVDVSMQQAVAWSLTHAQVFWDLTKSYPRREGAWVTTGITKARRRATWPCRDGYVAFYMWGGAEGAKVFPLLVEAMDEDGMATDYLKEKDWASWDIFRSSQEEIDHVQVPISNYFMKHSKRELYEEAVKRGIQLFPVTTPKDMVENVQLAFRDYWTEVEHPELDTKITYPGPFVKLSETPCGIWRRAPLIGEHNEEIYQKELGFSREELITLKQKGDI